MKIKTPFLRQDIAKLKAGDQVFITGTIYTARDAAHKKMFETKKIPFDLNGQIIYYCGPTPAKPGKAIGSCGPTTSSRMDKYTPFMLENGMVGMIGKGNRSQNVIEAIIKHGAVYFVATGGAAALLSKKVIKSEVIAFPELVAEAVYKLEVMDFPVIVAIDATGADLFKVG